MRVTLANAEQLVRQHDRAAHVSRQKPMSGPSYYTVHIHRRLVGSGNSKRHAWKDAAINLGLDL